MAFFSRNAFHKMQMRTSTYIFQAKRGATNGGGGCDDGPLLGGIVGGFFTFSLCGRVNDQSLSTFHFFNYMTEISLDVTLNNQIHLTSL